MKITIDDLIKGFRFSYTASGSPTRNYTFNHFEDADYGHQTWVKCEGDGECGYFVTNDLIDSLNYRSNYVILKPISHFADELFEL